MPVLTVTDARKNLFGLVDEIANEHRGYCIVGKRNQAVLISMEDWNAIQESLYLNGFPGLADSIVKGMKTPVSKCAAELKW
ncbi:MAG: type II toxin-antitoxin system Phd/YefM family antitoxin [Kiritimatiellae bacterium]|nr:type II toxin-antitoxin system Phd/YefM family antitoxin [Kiritimatiellia bacterium]